MRKKLKSVALFFVSLISLGIRNNKHLPATKRKQNTILHNQFSFT